MQRILLVALYCSGCGRLAFDARDDASHADGIVDPDARCTAWSAFGGPTRIDELSNPVALDGAPTATLDGLTVVLGSDRTGGQGGFDLYISTRAAPGAVFGAARNMSELNTSGNEIGPSLSDDGLTLYYTNAAAQLALAQRSSTTALFGTPTSILGTAAEYDQIAGAEIASNDLELMFTAIATVDSKHAIWDMTRSSAGAAWTTPRRLNELGTQDMGYPTLSSNGLELLYQQNADIYRATRADLLSPFGNPQPVGELNSASGDDDPAFADDGTVFFVSSRAGTIDVFVATRSCLD